MVGPGRPGQPRLRAQKNEGGGEPRARETPPHLDQRLSCRSERRNPPCRRVLVIVRARERTQGRMCKTGRTSRLERLFEVEVARRLLLEPEAVVLGRVLQELRRVLEDVLLLRLQLADLLRASPFRR